MPGVWRSELTVFPICFFASILAFVGEDRCLAALWYHHASRFDGEAVSAGLSVLGVTLVIDPVILAGRAAADMVSSMVPRRRLRKEGKNPYGFADELEYGVAIVLVAMGFILSLWLFKGAVGGNGVTTQGPQRLQRASSASPAIPSVCSASRYQPQTATNA